MSRDWSGLNLQTELATILGDTSTGFKTKVLGWLNDIQNDISTRHDWSFQRHKGKKVLTASSELQNVNLAKPSAPTATIATDGSLTEGSTYSVLVTYYESVSGLESIAGTASSTVTATALNKTVSLTVVPTSSDPLVTSRKLYLSKDSGAYYYHSSIANNTATTATIDTETTSLILAPDYNMIRKFDGSPFFEGTSTGRLTIKSVDEIRELFEGTWSSGTPNIWADMGEGRAIFYPIPSSALTLSHYYYRLPARIYANTDTLELPAWLKPVLEAGVIWKGYRYRDRDGQESKQANYEQLISEYISKMGRNNKLAGRVRDVSGGQFGVL